jgi:predicted ATP-grasp superfamily ATP-dependent carboligase
VHVPRPAAEPRVVVVVGASARAWAASAVRAGWHVHTVDLFADGDLLSLAASATRLGKGYPTALPAAVGRLPAGPLTYTGALENHPGVLAALALARPLAGVPPEALAAVRTPAGLARLARAARMTVPATRASARGLPRDGSWLIKPLHGAGGAGIEPWTGPTTARPGPDCWQRRVAGRAWGATYLIAPAGPRLVGVARQLLGPARRGAASFAWCAGVTWPPRHLPGAVHTALVRLGEALWGRDGLRGMIGVDFLVTPSGKPVLIEINPRPTASAELHERHDGRSLAAAHLECFGYPDAGRATPPEALPGAWAKALVRTPTAGRADDRLVDRVTALAECWTRLDGGWPALADIPTAGAVLPDHGPLLSVFAHGRHATAATRALAARRNAVDDLLRDWLRRCGAARPRRPLRKTGTASGTRPRSSPGKSS